MNLPCPFSTECRTCTCNEHYVCRCLQVTVEEVVVAITSLGLRTVRDVKNHTEAGGGCTACHRRIRKLLDEHSARETTVSLPVCVQ